MKKTIAALMLAAAAATPAMAQTYLQSDSWPADRAMPAQSSDGYGAYASVPGADTPSWDTTRITSPVFAMDPDPTVREQLQKQSDSFNR